MTSRFPGLPAFLILASGLFLASAAEGRAEVESRIVGSPQFFMDKDSAVAGVKDSEQALYQAQFFGAFGIRFAGLAPGSYKVVVGNAELAAADKNFRIFAITANGKTAVPNLNLNEQFGNATKADVSFPVEAADGTVEIGFVADAKHDVPRVSFVRLYDASGKLAAEETALAHKPKNWSPTSKGRLGRTLPDVIRVFPKSDPAAAFPELKVYDGEGRPWRAAAEDWDGARRRAESDPEWAKWVAGQRSELDRWIARHPRDRTAWVCGWYHDFVSPKNGSFLDWTDEVPGEEVPFLHSSSDPRVEITPKILGGWVCIFRDRHSEMMRTAARLYRLTGEEKYAAWAADQLDYYANHLLEWPESPRNDGARLYWQTLDEATNLVRYVECVRLLDGYAAPERKRNWKEKFFLPEAEMLNRTMQRIHNIATWHRCAAAQVALLFDDKELWKKAIDGEFGLRRQIACGVTGDYVWWEQSFGYNDYLVRAVLTLFQNAGIQGRAPELAEEMTIAENLMLSLTYIRMPNNQVPIPADTTAPVPAPDLGLFASAYRVFPTTAGLEAAAKKKSWDTLVDPPWPSPRPAVLPEVRSRLMESTRMAVLKSGPWQVFFHFGQLTSSHAQAETLNYDAFYKNVDVTHDTGTVGYGSPLHAGYYTRGLNHNLPLVDGEGQEVLPQAGVLDGFSEQRVAASLPDERSGVAAGRELRIDGENLIDTVTLKAAAPDAPERKLGLSLQLQGKVRLPQAFKRDADFSFGRPEPFTYWTDVTKAEFQDKAEFDVVFGSTGFHLTITGSAPFRIWHGSTPDTPPNRREGFYIETTGTNAVFTTVFAPLPSDAAAH